MKELEKRRNMKVIRYKPYVSDKPSALKGRFALCMDEWQGFIIEEMAHFEKNDSAWISFPNKKYESDGKIKYFNFNRFESFEQMKEFTSQVLKAINEFLNLNPEEKIEEFIF